MSHHLHTALIHAGTPRLTEGTGPVNVPVVRTSTLRYANMAEYDGIHERRAAGENVAAYGRHGLDTHRALESAIATLEDGQHCLLAPSGLAAITLTLLALLSPGDHALVQDSVYSPLRRVDQSLLKRLGIRLSYFSPGKDDLDALIEPQTRLLYLEAPSSLLYEIPDLPALAARARDRGVLVATDNTWASGYLYRPLALGADVSILAATKYISGHSDVMQGAVVVKDDGLAQQLRETSDSLGLAVSPDDAYLSLRGIRTLPVRMQQHQANALQVAQFLHSHPQVARVFYPALPSDPGHALWRRDFSGANGLLSFAFAQGDVQHARRFIDALELFAIGASWGGYESLVQLAAPARLAEHSYYQGNTPVVRLHIGLENPHDLIDDLSRAFQAAQG
ncbi:cystathionine beta-lyase [Herbaspirillum huttiense F1]|uniref:Cystathionine beta-lyase n=1 Tax=Herbaspirillum huttiense subsp. lycopersici TaxID=3074428 RepID=A0ABU2EIT9_9BURK|nr:MULTISPECIES: cystathionine beta-lyase [Herbaspirillum]MBP1313478.1 cystathionine beta-lyase [Herbaspirillum sp. 1130]MDR6738695.1 cystathionine beta-lyase [Herbaspirillum sp. 1173]MDR9847775.1 cystathionine beta-lyase [Herbaspirillum huttiense SE1]MDT0355251.1 cystathionine beta-lyase [Herbaspirillum huttiense F1]